MRGLGSVALMSQTMSLVGYVLSVEHHILVITPAMLLYT